MRVAINVPQQHRNAFFHLAEMENDALNALLKELDAADPDQESLRSTFAEADDEGLDLYEAVISAATFRSSRGLTARQMAEHLGEAIGDEAVKPRLTRLLDNATVTRLAKVGDLRWAHERVLNGARILTDVRPFFDDSEDAELMGSTIVPTLQLTYFSETGSHEIQLAMDRSDLTTLADQSKRALKKIEQLESALRTTTLAPMEGDQP